MEVVDGVVSPSLEVVALEDIERLQHLEGREGRRHRAHLETAVADADRLAPLGLELGEVGLREPAPRLLYGAGHGLGDGPAVKNLAAALDDLTQGRGKLLVSGDLARPRPPVAEIETLRLGRVAKLGARLLEEIRVHEGQRHALLCQFYGRSQHAPAGHAAEALE